MPRISRMKVPGLRGAVGVLRSVRASSLDPEGGTTAANGSHKTGANRSSPREFPKRSPRQPDHRPSTCNIGSLPRPGRARPTRSTLPFNPVNPLHPKEIRRRCPNRFGRRRVMARWRGHLRQDCHRMPRISRMKVPGLRGAVGASRSVRVSMLDCEGAATAANGDHEPGCDPKPAIGVTHVILRTVRPWRAVTRPGDCPMRLRGMPDPDRLPAISLRQAPASPGARFIAPGDKGIHIQCTLIGDASCTPMRTPSRRDRTVHALFAGAK